MAIHKWLDGLREHYADHLVLVDAEIAEEWGRLSAPRPLPVIDGLLAATAKVRGMTLVMRNARDVKGTGGAVIDPWKG